MNPYREADLSYEEARWVQIWGMCLRHSATTTPEQVLNLIKRNVERRLQLEAGLKHKTGAAFPNGPFAFDQEHDHS